MTHRHRERELIGNFFKEKRIAAGLTQTFLARKLGWTSSQFISNWERGLAIPPKKILNQLVELCHIDINEIIDVYADATRIEIDSLLNSPSHYQPEMDLSSSLNLNPESSSDLPAIGNINLQSQYVDRAIETLDNISHLFDQNDLSITPYSERSIQDFAALNEPKKSEIISHLVTYQEFAKEMAPHFNQNQTDVREEVACLKASLKGLGLKAGDEDLNFIDQGDIVEVYGIDGKQQYRNFEFIKSCPYDLLMVHTHEWFVLYERSPETNDQINQRIQEVISTDQTQSVPFDIPQHSLKVAMMEDEPIFNVNLKRIKPIFNEKTDIKTAFVATLVVEPTSPEEEESLDTAQLLLPH